MKAVKTQLAGSTDCDTARQPDELGAFAVPPRPDGYVALEWFEHAPGFVAFLDGADLVFTHANDAYKRLVGREHLVGLPFHIALPEVAEQGVAALCHEVIARGERHVERAREVQVRTPEGGFQLRYVDFVLQPIAQADGHAAGLLVQGSDVTMETISQRDLQFSLTHDLLTGLPNYAVFRDRLEHALRRTARVQPSLQVAALELDQFKRVNALLGREAGESILRDVARRIERAAGSGATVARENVDKFLLLFEGERQADASERIQDVVRALAEPFDHQGSAVYVTCCVGGATFPLSGQTANSLLLAADHALARAKEGGAGTLRWDDTSPGGAELERLQLGFALREALARGELEVHYQPQVDLLTGKACSMEALVRWTRAGEKVPPATLVGVAEECGLIGELGDWVLRTAWAQAVRSTQSPRPCAGA
jgi:diguanylate cyclase (GGDEF)-like protein